MLDALSTSSRATKGNNWQRVWKLKVEKNFAIDNEKNIMAPNSFKINK